MDRRKELKELYKTIKPDMGVFVIRSIKDNKCYIHGTRDLKSFINRVKFQLNFGSHPNKELQRDWTRYGESGFVIEILEKLEYDKDEEKTDYSEELRILQIICEEKLAQEGMELYKSD